MKLKEKIRDGSKVRRIYDQPRTPYKRVLEQPDISMAEKNNLTDIYMQLNPVTLKKNITRLQRKLMKVPTASQHSVPVRKNKRKAKTKEAAP